MAADDRVEPLANPTRRPEGTGTMRRLVLACLTVGLLLITTAAPAFAAQPFRESGTQNFLFSFASDCDETGNRTTCTDTFLDVFPVAPDTVVVCLNRFTFAFNERSGRGRLISDESGCTETSADALSVTVSDDTLTATLAPTDIVLVSCDQRRCTETDTVTVSARDSGSPVTAYSGRGSFREGGCRFTFSFWGQRADVTGTMTIDGVTIDQQGSASTEDYRVTERCR
jgi:hypothetical protein